jgi:hypothetical protein
MTWSVVELAGKPAGYADHKPPYDFKHGWKPISGAAAKAVAPKVEEPEDLEKLTPEQLNKIPRMHRLGPSKAMGHSKEQWRGIVNEALAKPDEPATPHVPEPVAPVKVMRKSRTKVEAPGPGISPTQQKALDNPDTFDQDELTPEWASATTKPRLTKRETEATHLWQNGYTTALSEEEDSEGVAAGDVGLYKILNAQLRGSGEYDGLDLPEEEWAQVEQMRTGMESALAKSRTTRDVTVFRGVSNLGNVAAGDTIRDAGWQATSMNPGLAASFMSGDIVGAKRKSSARMLVISVPKGTNALAVREKPENEKYFGIKHEIVLGPDTPLRVTKIEGDRVYAEVVR